MVKSRCSFFNNLFWVYFFCYLTGALGYVIRIIFSRGLSLEEFGTLYAVLGLFMLIGVFNDFGFSETINFFGTKFFEKKNFASLKRSIYYGIIMQTITSVLIGIVIFINAEFLGTIYFKSDFAVIVIRILVVFFVTLSVSNPLRTSFMTKQKAKISSGLETFRLIITALCASILLFSPGKIIIASLSWTLGSIALLLLTIILFRKEFKFLNKIHFAFDAKEYAETFKYASQIMLSLGATTFIWGIDVQMIVFFGNVSDVAYYSNAFSIASIIFIMLVPVIWILFPLTTKLLANDGKSELEVTVSAIYKGLLFIGVPLLTLFLAFPQELLVLMYGALYGAGKTALFALSFGLFFMSYASVNSSILSGMGKVKERNFALFITAILNIIGNYIGIMTMGYVGVAIATTASYFFYFLITSYIVRSEIRIIISAKYIFKVFITSIIIYLVAFFLKKTLQLNFYLEALVIGALVLTAYLSLNHILGLFGTRDILRIFAKK
jgi:O-antigen/teichoic acid export membrane protein